MNVQNTSLPGVLLLEPKIFADPRGFFLESYNRRVFAGLGLDLEFVQDNHSKSCRNTLRGMHLQLPPKAQDKLVRVLSGEIFDVVVDLRHGSPTFRQWEGHRLDANSMRMLFIPKGFAHGFCVLSETAEIFYKCTDFYAPDMEMTLRWDDPMIGIRWPVTAPILSGRDQKGQPFDAMPEAFAWP